MLSKDVVCFCVSVYPSSIGVMSSDEANVLEYDTIDPINKTGGNNVVFTFLSILSHGYPPSRIPFRTVVTCLDPLEKANPFRFDKILESQYHL